MGAARVPQVGTASRCRKGVASGFRKWVPQVGAATGCRKDAARVASDH